MGSVSPALLLATLLGAGPTPGAPEPLWVARYHHGTIDGDAALSSRRCIASDSDGNVYVAGTVGLGNNLDGPHLLLVKYGPDGEVAWSRSGYEHQAGGTVAVATDGEGRPYVVAGATGSALVVLAYDVGGNLRWSARPDLPPGATSGDAAALAVSPDGRVAATGTVYGGGAQYDLVTYQFGAAGQVVWAARYDGPTHGGSAWAQAVALGPAGEVLVAGQARGTGTWKDYLTLKYDAAGQQAWAVLYDGPPGGRDDNLHDLAVDDAGGVYVTGASCSGVTTFGWATLKYDTHGTLQWLARHDEPGPGGGYSTPAVLALAQDGSVFVAGSSEPFGGVRSALTLKYSSKGALLWSAPWVGSTLRHASAGAVALAPDEAGGVYVAATTGPPLGPGDLASLHYDSAGQLAWSATRATGRLNEWAASLVLDGKGHLRVVGSSSGGPTDDWVVLSYDEQGRLEWTAGEPPETVTYESPSGPRAMALDAGGDVYVVATLLRKDFRDDYLTIRFSGGQPLWARVYDNGGRDWPRAIALDEAGNVYVTGGSDGPDQTLDFATLKYDKNGELRWVARFEQGTVASDLAVDDGGDVYVTGGGATVKYDTHGALQWTLGRSGTALSLAVGRVHVTGNVSSAGTSLDFATAAYDTEGNLLWESLYAGVGGWKLDQPVALAVDGAGRAIVTGTSEGNGTGVDIATVAYDANGTQLWASRFASAGSGDDRPGGLAADGAGNVHVTGTATGAGTDLVTLKYDAQGAQLWGASYGGPGNESAGGLAVDAAGRAYVAGRSCPTSGSCSAVTLMYEPAGGLLWSALFGESAAGQALRLDGLNQPTVLAASWTASTLGDVAVIRYPGPPWSLDAPAAGSASGLSTAAGAAGRPAASAAPRPPRAPGARRPRSRAAAPAPAR